MDMSPQEYQAYIKQKSPRSPIVKDTVLAFLIGGAICVLGQLILDGYRSLGLDKTDAGTATSVTLIFLAALTTGLNLYNSLARFAGAGTLVPITGFANSVVSPAIDFKAEDEQVPNFSSERESPEDMRAFSKGRAESCGDSAPERTWRSHGPQSPAALR